MKKIIILIFTIILIYILYILYQTVYLDYKNDIILDIDQNDIYIQVFNDYIIDKPIATFRNENISNKIKIVSYVNT